MVTTSPNLADSIVRRVTAHEHYKLYNLPPLHHEVQRGWHVIEKHHLVVSADGDYTTLSYTQDNIVCTLTKGYMCHMNTSLYPVSQGTWCSNALFTNNVQRILSKHRTSFQLVYLSNSCEAYSPNGYIPATVELTKEDPTLMLHRCFPWFNLICINILDYHLMQALKLTALTPSEIWTLSYHLPTYTPVNCESLIKQVSQINEDYPFSMHTQLIVATLVGVTLIIVSSLLDYCCFTHMRKCSNLVPKASSRIVGGVKS